MAPQTEPGHRHDGHHHHHHPFHHFIHSTTTALLSLLPPSKPSTPKSSFVPPPRICLPLTPSRFDATEDSSVSSSSASNHASSLKGVPSSSSQSGTGFPSSVRVSSLSSSGNGAGPAFVGQVFSMCDLSGTGLMAVSTHFELPFLSKRTPEWLKKMFALITNSERNGPVFRFFMDLGDAVNYVKKLNVRSGVVGACRLDIAYEHFKEKPQLFQFVPSEKQVKAANKLLKTFPPEERQKVEGVPVFSAQNLDIAIATCDGIKWYTPYFFDKSMLDNILEGSVDQHFDGLIHMRNMQRRSDVIDDSMESSMPEEITENIWDPPEVQEVLDEMGHPGIPLSIITKAAEIELLHAVDRVLLGNRWLRKATGIQPKFPYMIDSFERRSAASLLRASASTSSSTGPSIENDNSDSQLVSTSRHDFDSEADLHAGQVQHRDLRLPFMDWFDHVRPKHKQKPKSREFVKQNLQPSPFLPKITMVGISTGEAGQMSKSTLKKTMEDLTKELEVGVSNSSGDNETNSEYRDPLFVANVGEYYTGAKTPSPRWVRGGNS